MKAETLHTFARVRSLALARMIEAGGKPCWVAAYAPDDSPAALPLDRPLPRRTRVTAAPRAALAGSSGSTLSAAEVAAIADPDGRLVAAMNRAFSHFAAAAPPKAAHAGGVRSALPLRSRGG
jgi:hypothetical protein